MLSRDSRRRHPGRCAARARDPPRPCRSARRGPQQPLALRGGSSSRFSGARSSWSISRTTPRAERPRPISGPDSWPSRVRRIVLAIPAASIVWCQSDVKLTTHAWLGALPPASAPPTNRRCRSELGAIALVVSAVELLAIARDGPTRWARRWIGWPGTRCLGAYSCSSAGRSRAAAPPARRTPATRLADRVAESRGPGRGGARARPLSLGGGAYLGVGQGGSWALADPESAVMVLGPPRSGKTSAVMIPAVMGRSGAVIATSTKPEVMRATVASALGGGPGVAVRSRPASSDELPGVRRLCLVAGGGGRAGTGAGDGQGDDRLHTTGHRHYATRSHWTERRCAARAAASRRQPDKPADRRGAALGPAPGPRPGAAGAPRLRLGDRRRRTGRDRGNRHPRALLDLLGDRRRPRRLQRRRRQRERRRTPTSTPTRFAASTDTIYITAPAAPPEPSARR